MESEQRKNDIKANLSGFSSYKILLQRIEVWQ